MVSVQYPLEMALANMLGRVLVMASYRWLPGAIRKAFDESWTPPPSPPHPGPVVRPPGPLPQPTPMAPPLAPPHPDAAAATPFTPADIPPLVPGPSAFGAPPPADPPPPPPPGPPELIVFDDGASYWQAVDQGLYEWLDRERTVALLDPDKLGAAQLSTHAVALVEGGFRVLVFTGDRELTAALGDKGVHCAIAPGVNELGYRIGLLFSD